MLDLIGRAIHHEALTPSERAFLKLIQGFIITGIVAALSVLVDALTGDNQAITTATIWLVVGTFIHAVLVAVAKYLSAQNDPVLQDAGTVVSDIANAVDERLQASGSGEVAAAETTQVRAIGRTYQPKPPAAPQG